MTNDDKHSPADIQNDEDITNSDVDDDVDEKSSLLSSREQSLMSSEEDESDLDPEFNQPPPSRLKRFGLALFAVILFWIAIQMRSAVLESEKKPKVVYASRYSKEHKFRPAASPIITETLKDGRIRLRGATPPPTAIPKPKPKPVAKATRKKTSPSKKKARKGQRKGSVANKRI